MNIRTITLVALATLFVACTSIPPHNTALDQARSAVNAAQNDPQVAALAPEELSQAVESLRVAERAMADDATTTTVNHLAYMTVQRARIASDTASSKAAQAVIASAAAERDRLLLAQRTSEAERAHDAAETARSELAASEQSNTRIAGELADADATAMLNDARVSDLEAQLKDLNAKQTDRGLVVTLGDVLFDTGQAQILASGSGNITKLAEFFKRNPDRTGLIEGFTDDVGSSSSNFVLSQQRANAVMTALIDMGVQANRLTTLAHGEDNPAADNSTAAGRQMNRRVEIVITPRSADVVSRQ
jgi:outer membrane protein OmpA-like peptidoglycan-associated protein